MVPIAMNQRTSDHRRRSFRHGVVSAPKLNTGAELGYKLAGSHESSEQMTEDAQRQPDGRFKKGHRRIIGRVKGEPNKIGRDLKAGILDAAIEHGSDGNGKDGLKGCASWLLREHTKAFVPLLVRLLPLQVSGEVVKHTKLQVNVVSIPRGHYYTKDGVLHPPRDRCIEHNVDEVAATAEEQTSTVEELAASAAPPRNDDGAPLPMTALILNNTAQDE